MYGCLNDMFFFNGEELGFRNLFVDPASGKFIRKKIKGNYNYSHGGRVDGTWTLISSNNRRSGRGYGTPGFRANLLVWDEKVFIAPGFAVDRKKLEDRRTGKTKVEKGKKMSRKERLRRVWDSECVWEAEGLESHQVEAMVWAGKNLVYAGRIIDKKEKKWSFFLMQGLAENGKKVSEIPLEDAPVYEGIAVAQGKIFIALRNGKLVCLGEEGKAKP
jgi:hypothetical protein